MGCASIHSLSATEVDTTFVLARLGYPEMTPLQWRNITARILGQGEGPGRILVETDAGGRHRGLLVYAMSPSVTGRQCLHVERLIVFDILDPQAIADRLLAEVLRLAEIQDCDRLSLIVPLNAQSEPAALVLASQIAQLHKVF
jgi:hypothetical protein